MSFEPVGRVSMFHVHCVVNLLAFVVVRSCISTTKGLAIHFSNIALRSRHLYKHFSHRMLQQAFKFYWTCDLGNYSLARHGAKLLSEIAIGITQLVVQLIQWLLVYRYYKGWKRFFLLIPIIFYGYIYYRRSASLVVGKMILGTLNSH